MANGLLGQIANPNVPSFGQSFAQASPIFEGIRQREEQGQQRAKMTEQQEIVSRLQEAQIVGSAPSRSDIQRLGKIAPDTMRGFAESFGIPVGENARVMSMMKDAQFAQALAKVDPDLAYDFTANQRDLFQSFGMDTAKTDQLLSEWERDPKFAMANLNSIVESGKAAGLLRGPEEKFISFDPKTGQAAFRQGGRVRVEQAEGFEAPAEERTGKEVQSQVNTLRDAIRNTTKSFRQVEEARNRITKSGIKGTAASDISLIFNFMKMNDPGSTVREGEFATAQNAAGVPDRAVNLYNRLLEGTRLSKDQRVEFIDQAESLFEAQRDASDTQIGNVLQQADQDEIGRGRVLGKDRLAAFDERQASRAPAAQEQAPAVTTQAEFDALPSGALYTEDGQQFRKP